MNCTTDIDACKRELVGQGIEQLDSPVLLLDGPASARNLAKMASFFDDRPCKLRPHFKNHKSATLARRQLQAGNAVGITCAKLGEAQVLAHAGFDDVLIANQILGHAKIARLAKLAGQIKLKVAADAPEQVAQLSEAATAVGSNIGVLVEVDIGMGRCGVQPGQSALELAQKICQTPGVGFEGLQAYEGHTVYFNDFNERAQKTQQAMQLAIDSRRLIEQSGIEVNVISGGSSSTHAITGAMPGVDEIQAGTYATMDWRYGELISEFEIAMSLLVRVISKRPGAAVLDVGVKGAGGEFGLPRIKNHPEVEIPFFAAEEHLLVNNAPDDWRVGSVVELIPSHACTTCNLHRMFHVHAEGKVVDIWPIEGSGMLV